MGQMTEMLNKVARENTPEALKKQEAGHKAIWARIKLKEDMLVDKYFTDDEQKLITKKWGKFSKKEADALDKEFNGYDASDSKRRAYEILSNRGADAYNIRGQDAKAKLTRSIKRDRLWKSPVNVGLVGVTVVALVINPILGLLTGLVALVISPSNPKPPSRFSDD